MSKAAGIGSFAGLLAFAPLAALAAPTFKQIVEGPIMRIGDLLVTLLYAIAFLVFIFGIFKYFFGSGANAEENRQKGKQLMLWGVISLAVLFAVWGIVKVLLGLLQSWA